jgi:hypothetical protein
VSIQVVGEVWGVKSCCGAGIGHRCVLPPCQYSLSFSEDTFSGATLRNAAGNPMRPDGILLDKDGVRMMAKVSLITRCRRLKVRLMREGCISWGERVGVPH